MISVMSPWCLSNQTIRCWGAANDTGLRNYGQLGYGNTDGIGTTNGSMKNCVDVNLGTGFKVLHITAGWAHTCVLSVEYEIRCFGRNFAYGQLGLGHELDIGDEPGEMGDNMSSVELGSDFVPIQLSCGQAFCCTLSNSSQIKCWGL